MELSRVTEEIGPDEDHQIVRKHKHLKVIEVESNKPAEILCNSGVLEVTPDDPVIDKFLSDVPLLIGREKTHGLIWNKNLQPADCRYDLGEHYLSTRETERKSMQGTVSFYRDGVTGIKFAIKTLSRDALFRADEIKLALTKQHTNICSVYGIIIREGCVNILLEHAGSPLTDERAWIAETPDRMLSLARQSFQALEAVHGRGYVHCDIKPDNIMIVKEGNEFTVKLIDFGSCHQTGTVLPYDTPTTLEYWSPEVWQALDTKMTKTPDDLLFIALPEEIPSDLRAVMKQCLNGRPENRLSAAQAVKQLTEDVSMQSPSTAADEINYKDSFQRICSSLHEAAGGRPTRIDRGTVFQVPSVSLELTKFSPETPPIQYFIGSSKGIEKRELKTVTKTRKTDCSTGNKLSKTRSKGKKSVKISSKLCPPNMPKPFVEATGKVVPISDPIPDKGTEMKTDDKAYPCSTVLKNLALRVQPNSGMVIQSPQRPVSSKEKNTSEQLSLSCVKPVTEDVKESGRSSFESLEVQNKAMQTAQDVVKETVKEPVDWTPKFIGDNPESGTREKHKKESSSEPVNAEAKGKLQQQSSREVTDIIIHPSVNSQTVDQPRDPGQGNATKNISKADEVTRSTEDDMEFVISVFDDSILTGGDDDIIDNWMHMLDEDDGNTGTDGESFMEVTASQATSEVVSESAHRISEVEPMDTGNEQTTTKHNTSISSKSAHNMGRESRKRMAESMENPSGIPGKAVCLTSLQHSANKHQLPDFDQILPENF